MHRRIATGWFRSLTILTLVVMLAGMILTPAAITAQDAAIPIAVDGGATETPVADQSRDTSGDPTATATEVATESDPVTPEINDQVAPVDGPLSVTAGKTVAMSLDYLVSTVRAGTAIHIELRLPDGSVPADWNLTVNDVSGAGRVDLTDPLAEAGTAALAIAATAPDGAETGQVVEVHVSSFVDLGDGNGAIVRALDGTAALATIVVAASEEPTEEPASGTPIDSATPIAVDPTDAPPIGTPVVDTPTETASPAATPIVIDISAEFKLQNRAVTKTVRLDSTNSATVDYLYSVTADRVSTTIHAEMVGADDKPVAGWTVSLNGAAAGADLVDAEHISAGSEFPVSVKVTADKTVAPSSTAHLRFAITIESPGVGPAQNALSGIRAMVLVDVTDTQTGTVDGPSFKTLGGVTPSSVTPTGSLTCTGHSNPYGPNGDGAVPGQVLDYECDLPGGLLATLSGSVSMTVVGTGGWQFRVHYSVRIGVTDTLIDSGFTTTT